MMTSLVQVQSLVMAQVSQAVQERIRELAVPETPTPARREEEPEWPLDEDDECLMQKSMMVATGTTALGPLASGFKK